MEVTLGNLIQSPYLVAGKTEGVAPIVHLISRDILTFILYSTSAITDGTEFSCRNPEQNNNKSPSPFSRDIGSVSLMGYAHISLLPVVNQYFAPTTSWVVLMEPHSHLINLDYNMIVSSHKDGWHIVKEEKEFSCGAGG